MKGSADSSSSSHCQWLLWDRCGAVEQTSSSELLHWIDFDTTNWLSLFNWSPFSDCLSYTIGLRQIFFFRSERTKPNMILTVAFQGSDRTLVRRHLGRKIPGLSQESQAGKSFSHPTRCCWRTDRSQATAPLFSFQAVSWCLAANKDRNGKRCRPKIFSGVENQNQNKINLTDVQNQESERIVNALDRRIYLNQWRRSKSPQYLSQDDKL